VICDTAVVYAIGSGVLRIRSAGTRMSSSDWTLATDFPWIAGWGRIVVDDGRDVRAHVSKDFQWQVTDWAFGALEFFSGVLSCYTY
jgi:hypothetical protein